MDHETVLIFIEKLNAAKEAIKTAAPHEPAFAIANQNIINIEKKLKKMVIFLMKNIYIIMNNQFMVT